jgi:hypothetical protein
VSEATELSDSIFEIGSQTEEHGFKPRGYYVALIFGTDKIPPQLK